MRQHVRSQLTRDLARLGFDDFLVCIANAALARGANGSKDSVRALTDLITALAPSLNAPARGKAACALRDAADKIENELLDIKR